MAMCATFLSCMVSNHHLGLHFGIKNERCLVYLVLGFGDLVRGQSRSLIGKKSKAAQCSEAKNLAEVQEYVLKTWDGIMVIQLYVDYTQVIVTTIVACLPQASWLMTLGDCREWLYERAFGNVYI